MGIIDHILLQFKIVQQARGNSALPLLGRGTVEMWPINSVILQSIINNWNLKSVVSCLQPLTIFQRSLTTMQIQIQGLLQFAVPLFPTAEVSHTQETKLWILAWRAAEPNDFWGAGLEVWTKQAFIDIVVRLLHREIYWVSSICSTPQKPVYTSWPPCWTAGGSTRFVHCILFGITEAQVGQQWSKWPRRIAASNWRWNFEDSRATLNRKNSTFKKSHLSNLHM